MRRLLLILLMALLTTLVAAPASAKDRGQDQAATIETGCIEQTTTTAKSVAETPEATTGNRVVITIWVPTTTALLMDEDTATTEEEDVALFMRPTRVVEVTHNSRAEMFFGFNQEVEGMGQEGHDVLLCFIHDKVGITKIHGPEVAITKLGVPPTEVALQMFEGQALIVGTDEGIDVVHELALDVGCDVAIEVGCSPQAEVAPLGTHIYLGFIHADEGTDSSNPTQRVALTAATRLLMNSA